MDTTPYQHGYEDGWQGRCPKSQDKTAEAWEHRDYCVGYVQALIERRNTDTWSD